MSIIEYPRKPDARKACGFSLIELLVAMTLGLLLVSGMISVFAANKRSTELNDATANMQENVRFAMGAIASDVRMAGHQGCAPLDGGSLTILANNVPMDNRSVGLTATAVSGSVVESATSWDPPPALGSGANSARFTIPASRPAVPGTHTLAIQFGEPATFPFPNDGVSMTGMATMASPVVADGEMKIQPGDFAIVSNCFGADLFRADSVVYNSATDETTLTHSPTVNTNGNLTEPYGTPATWQQTRIMRFASNVYFIADTGLKNSSGDSVTALYQQSLPYQDSDNPPTELIQGVENLRLSFGVQNAVGQLQYMQPEDVTDFSRIRAVRIGLLMSSWGRIAEQDDIATYMLAGEAIPAAAAGATALSGSTHPRDRRHRLAFNTTVKVRNYR